MSDPFIYYRSYTERQKLENTRTVTKSYYALKQYHGAHAFAYKLEGEYETFTEALEMQSRLGGHICKVKETRTIEAELIPLTLYESLSTKSNQ